MIDPLHRLRSRLVRGASRETGDAPDPAQRALAVGRVRLFALAAFFGLGFAAVGWRLIDVTLLKASAEAKKHTQGRTVAADTAAPGRESARGEITDRHGELLAASIATWSLFADPKMVVDAEKTAQRLVRLFPDQPIGELREKLKGEKRFAWVRRHLTPREYQEVIGHGLPGIGARKDSRRVYPVGAPTAHLVGYADIDNTGLAGIERQFDSRLRRGESIALSIDLRVQHIVRAELAAAVRKFQAIGAMGILVDVRTGEVLAMVSLPEFDPHQPHDGAEERRFNRATLGTYEMGSTFKILNTAMALDAGTATLTKRYDASRPLQHGKFTINDYHGMGRALTVSEIFMYSSNIGSARMALEAGTGRQSAFLARAGMLQPTPIELPENAAPLFPREWKTINTITISFGHGISVTPLHLIAAVAAIANDGKRAPVTLLKRAPGEPIPFAPMVSEKTAAEMRQLMRLVVERGTGKRAEAPGFLVGGKTGTADKSAGKKGYRRNTRISSFVGAFPIDAPRYAILAMIDEPKATADAPEPTGGVVAAPVVREIVLKAGPLLGVLPRDVTSEKPADKPPARPKPISPVEKASRE
jgi:cell division protein FtsI (penicillin-binding protein 3)